MAMTDPHRKNHVRAGAFVFFALALFIVVLITIAGGSDLWRRTTRYVVRFPLEVGATGLAEGSDVRVGGRTVGAVGRIDLAYEDADRPPVGVDVTIRIERGIPVFDDAVAFLERPLFGASSVINFPSLGGAASTKRLDAGARIPGLVAPPELLRNAGYGPEQSKQLRGILNRMDSITIRADSVVKEFDDVLFPQLKTAINDAGSLLSDMRERSGPWFDRADAVTKNIESMSTEANAAVKDGRAFIGKIDGLLTEHEDSFSRTVANVESATESADTLLARINDQTVARLNDLLDEGRQRVKEAGDVIEQASSLLGEQAPEIRVSVANMRLASEQMKLMMGEIRRSPWRLLYRPKTHELEYELLYDSARTYASAVSDLRAASESLESVLGSDGSRLATDGEPLKAYVARITEAFDKYRTAEKTFLDTLLKQKSP